VTDLESFQRALKAQDQAGPPGPAPDAPDSSALNIGEIMAQGRRLRRRRRAAAAGGCLCLAAAAFAAVIGISHLSRPSTSPALSPATRSASPRASQRQVSPAPEGRVVPTGIQTAAGEVVIYGIRVHLRELPGTTFGLMAALRDASGVLTPEITTNETTGSDTAAGFHAVEAAMTVGTPAAAMPEFGYYAGPAVKITALDGTQHVRAHLARWSANPRVVIFWFTPAADPGGGALHDLAAYNTAGRHITSGHTANAGHSGRG
jgi:hypothetical protein